MGKRVEDCMRKTAISVAAALIASQALAAPVTSPIKAPGGATIGQVTLTDAPKGVLLHIEASGLTPGWHAVHFHEKGDCSDMAFKMSGSHTHMATPAVHGLLNPQANDTGDLPNIYAGADGKATAELFSPSVALTEGTGRSNLLDADGSAVVIHAKPDDYTTQPIGGAGDRVACAVVK